jgi:hypothetical protein
LDIHLSFIRMSPAFHKGVMSKPTKEGLMDRRAFVRGLMGVAAAAAVATTLSPEAAQAGPMPVLSPDAPKTEAERTESDFRPDVDGMPSTEKAQYYYRRRRVFYRRRRIYRRRVYYRPIYRRRVYYRRRYYW